jgi:hypothetical protein
MFVLSSGLQGAQALFRRGSFDHQAAARSIAVNRNRVINTPRSVYDTPPDQRHAPSAARRLHRHGCEAAPARVNRKKRGAYVPQKLNKNIMFFYIMYFYRLYQVRREVCNTGHCR